MSAPRATPSSATEDDEIRGECRHRVLGPAAGDRRRRTSASPPRGAERAPARRRRPRARPPSLRSSSMPFRQTGPEDGRPCRGGRRGRPYCGRRRLHRRVGPEIGDAGVPGAGGRRVGGAAARPRGRAAARPGPAPAVQPRTPPAPGGRSVHRDRRGPRQDLARRRPSPRRTPEWPACRRSGTAASWDRTAPAAARRSRSRGRRPASRWRIGAASASSYFVVELCSWSLKLCDTRSSALRCTSSELAVPTSFLLLRHRRLKVGDALPGDLGVVSRARSPPASPRPSRAGRFLELGGELLHARCARAAGCALPSPAVPAPWSAGSRAAARWGCW